MKLRYKVLGVVVVYLIGNALYSDSLAVFFGHLIAHVYLTLLVGLIYGIFHIIIPDEMEHLESAIKDFWDTILLTMEPSGRLDDVLKDIHLKH